MKIAVYSTQPYDKRFLEETNQTTFADNSYELIFHHFPLSQETVALADGCEAVCVFVNDDLNGTVVEELAKNGTKAILLRCAGFNNVDLKKAEELGLFVARVSAYSPEAVAEFAVALMQTLNRNTHRAYNRVREGNFQLEGLLGFTLHGKTVGIVGTGKIGISVAKILQGYRCRLLAFDPFVNQEFNKYGDYVELDSLLKQSDVVTLHCPLMDSTRHLINEESLKRMKPGAMLVNTSRGGLIDTGAVIKALKTRHLGHLALDVYELEGNIFYQDHSGDIIDDDVFQRLMTFPNVLVCGHQAFFTREALQEISETTLRNLESFVNGTECKNALTGKK